MKHMAEGLHETVALAPKGPEKAPDSKRVTMLWRAIAAGGALALLATGCGASADSKSEVVAPHCVHADIHSPIVHFALKNQEPAPSITVHRGTRVVISSHYGGHEMTYPAPHPDRGVCELSESRSNNVASVTYEATGVGESLGKGEKIVFSSIYVTPTDANMPVMFGDLTIAP